MNNIITISSDFGYEDYFVGVMKGVILSINSDAMIIDINNYLPKFDIEKASITLRNSFSYFPKGTVHMVVVDPGVGSDRRGIIVVTKGYMFVGPDNGVFSFIYKHEISYKVYEISNEDFFLGNVSSTFHGRDIFSPVTAYLSKGVSPSKIGGVIKDPLELEQVNPSINEDIIEGIVVYEDKFGNLITNINNDLIELEDSIIIDDIKTFRIGSSGFLEIAVNRGRASEVINKEKKVKVIKKWNITKKK